MLDRSRSRDRSKAGGAFSPAGLFVSGAQGAWYDPSDFSTLFQNSTGTTPVTAVEQPVRLMLDRSRGLVLGGELVNLASLPTPTISNNLGTVGVWDAATRTMSNTGSAASDHPRFTFALGLVVGRTYFVTGVLSGSLTQINSPAGIRLAASGSANTVPYNSATGVFSGYVVAAATNLQIVTDLDGAESLTISSLSVRELPGNHALAPNDASRPVLRARYNQITFSEQFDNAAWTKTRATVTANAGVAPDGTTTADTFTEDSTASSTHVVTGPSSGAPSYTTAATVTASIFVKIAFGTRNVAIRVAGNNGSAVAIYNPSTGAFVTSTTTGTNWTFVSSSVTALADGWYRITCTGTHTETSGGLQLLCNLVDNSNLSYTGDGTSGILIWGAQLLTSADQTSTGGAYQRIAAATDYDTSNPVWRPYLAFDGSDDSFSTSAIDFSGTDEMTVFAGVHKASDAAVAIVMSYNGTSNASAEMFAPRTTGANGDFAFSHRTTTVQEAGAATVVLSPATAVLTGISDISASSVQLRRNGAVVQTVTTAIDANNYTSGTIRVGHRSSNLYLNGRLYSLAVLGRTATAAELSAMEAWVNGKTGGY